MSVPDVAIAAIGSKRSGAPSTAKLSKNMWSRCTVTWASVLALSRTMIPSVSSIPFVQWWLSIAPVNGKSNDTVAVPSVAVPSICRRTPAAIIESTSAGMTPGPRRDSAVGGAMRYDTESHRRAPTPSSVQSVWSP